MFRVTSKAHCSNAKGDLKQIVWVAQALQPDT
jgi:hypothetical protein